MVSMSNINSTWSDGQYLNNNIYNIISYCGQDLIYSMNMPSCMRWVMFYVLWDSISKHCLPNDSLIKKLKWKQGKERERTWSKTFFWFFTTARSKVKLNSKIGSISNIANFYFSLHDRKNSSWVTLTAFRCNWIYAKKFAWLGLIFFSPCLRFKI